MTRHKKIISIACSIFLICFFACDGKGSSDGKLAKAIVGTWQFDTATFKNDPQIRREIEKNPEIETVFTMFESMQLIYTKNTVRTELSTSGQTQSSVNKYKVISESGNVLIIESLEANGGQSRITFINDDLIKVIQARAQSGPPLVFKRIN
ncbi:MAG: hypothetical protein JW881_04100 [Spirochaetales bacterium]|nr:hypothetical protein [Spirochaetales bacterium]